jgi:hypothetical protein
MEMEISNEPHGEKSQLPNYKSQINSKLQFQITKNAYIHNLNFGHSCPAAGRGIYSMLGAWDLVLNIKPRPL